MSKDVNVSGNHDLKRSMLCMFMLGHVEKVTFGIKKTYIRNIISTFLFKVPPLSKVIK